MHTDPGGNTLYSGSTSNSISFPVSVLTLLWVSLRGEGGFGGDVLDQHLGCGLCRCFWVVVGAVDFCCYLGRGAG